MTLPRLRLLLAGAALLSPVAALHAAPIATITCTGSTPITANLSYFDIGITNPIPSASSGAGAGKATLKPILLHTGLVQFPHFFQLAITGATLQQCVITTTSANGSQVKFTLKDGIVQSTDAVSQHGRTLTDEPASYVEVSLFAVSVAVDVGSSFDDGGKTPYNGVTNSGAVANIP